MSNAVAAGFAATFTKTMTLNFPPPCDGEDGGCRTDINSLHPFGTTSTTVGTTKRRSVRHVYDIQYTGLVSRINKPNGQFNNPDRTE